MSPPPSQSLQLLRARMIKEEAQTPPADLTGCRNCLHRLSDCMVPEALLRQDLAAKRAGNIVLRARDGLYRMFPAR